MAYSVFRKKFPFLCYKAKFRKLLIFWRQLFYVLFFFANTTTEERQIFGDSYSHWPGLSTTIFLFSGKRAFDSLKLFKVRVLGTSSPCFRFASSFRIEYNFRWNCTYFNRVLHDKSYRDMFGYSVFAPTSANIFCAQVARIHLLPYVDNFWTENAAAFED